MSKFVIIPDTSCDLSKEMMKEYDIPALVAGTLICPDGTTKILENDWTHFTPEEFYGIMKQKDKKFSTTTPLFEESVDTYKKYLAEGYDIITFSLSAALSGSYNVAIQASKKALEEYPDRRIYNVDSMRYSTSHTLLVTMAAKLRLAGKSFDEVVEWTEKNKFCIHQMGPMDDLFFLAHAGRISNFKAFFGTMAGVNPMADFNRTGVSEVLVKCKGKAMAFDVTLEYMKRTIVDPENNTVFIAHTNRKQFAEKLKEMVEKEFHPKEVILTEVGITCGANIGPGLVAAFYYGKELSENLADEKEYMKEIMDNYKNNR